MRLILLLLATYMALVAACPPLPYRLRLMKNKTSDQIPNLVDDDGPATGWIHEVGSGSLAQPWPRGPDGIVRIKYCFRDQKSQDQLAHHIDEAFRKWSSRLGQPSKQHGHALAKPEELVKDGKAKLCRKGNDWGKLLHAFRFGPLLILVDPDVPEETIEIYVVDEEIPGAMTVLGYRDNEP